MLFNKNFTKFYKFCKNIIKTCRLADAFNITVDQLLGYDANSDADRYVDLNNLVLEYYHKKKEAEYKLRNDFPV